MSEIKGQLLGLLLVLTIFGVVGGSLIAVFEKTRDAVVQRVDEAIPVTSSD
ncbi:MAG: hypothetical protein ACI32C_02495 [Candidatus Enteromonas sp.]